MSSSEITDPTLKEAADVLQQQLIYNGEVLDISLSSLKAYTPGTQSLTFLDSSVHLAYALLKMLEKWGKSMGSETYVRQKTSKRRQRRNTGRWHSFLLQITSFNPLKGKSEEDGIPDVEEYDEEDEIVHETLFTFEAFQSVWYYCFLMWFTWLSKLEIRKCGHYTHSSDILVTLSRFRIIGKYATCSRFTPQASYQSESRRLIL